MYELKYESHLFLKTSKLEEEKLSIIQALLKPARCICRKYAALRGVKGNSLDFFIALNLPLFRIEANKAQVCWSP